MTADGHTDGRAASIHRSRHRRPQAEHVRGTGQRCGAKSAAGGLPRADVGDRSARARPPRASRRPEQGGADDHRQPDGGARGELFCSLSNAKLGTTSTARGLRRPLTAAGWRRGATTPRFCSASPATPKHDSATSQTQSASPNAPPNASSPTSFKTASSPASAKADETATPSTPKRTCAIRPNSTTRSANCSDSSNFTTQTAPPSKPRTNREPSRSLARAAPNRPVRTDRRSERDPPPVERQFDWIHWTA